MGLRATSHLCVKREQPLIITYSLYSENIMHYYFYLKHVREGDIVAHAENLALSQLCNPSLLVRLVENECVFGCLRTLLEASGGFAEL